MRSTEKSVYDVLVLSTGTGRRSADANLMFEGIGSNSQQVERSELSGHRHCLSICENAYHKR